MAAVSLVPADLEPFAEIDEAKALAMIEDALALAARVAPCILAVDFEYEAAARAILRGAILRWNDAGTGGVTSESESLGEYSRSQTFDSRQGQVRRSLFWPSEIEQLQDMCKGELDSGAFAIDTVSSVVVHADICSLNFGAAYCSCGANLTGGYPLYEWTP